MNYALCIMHYELTKMLGAIIGDIVGSAYEFNPTNDYNFKLFPTGCGFTDDTVCTVAVADALMHSQYTFGESIHYWCRKYSHPKGGYGGRFNRWVASDNPQPYDSFGNGSAMRVSPIGWWYHTKEDVLEAAKATADCTHNHPEGVKGAQAVALAVFLANNARLEGKTPDASEIVKECVEFSSYDIDIDWSRVRNKFDETCQGTVPVALAIIRDSKDFEDALRRAVSLGADADTLGAIVGSIAEPIWGIPDWMKAKALDLLPSEMKKVLSDFRQDVGSRRLEAKMEADKADREGMEAMMLWKLGLGNMGRFFNGENPLPEKNKIADAKSWNIEPMPEGEDSVTIPFIMHLSSSQMDVLRRGHIPDAQEDHWFMYTDWHHIRYYRSWTGMAAFEAHYMNTQAGYAIDRLTINKNLCQWGVNGNEAGAALFRYLIAAETNQGAHDAWRDFINTCRRLAKKYSEMKYTPENITELKEDEIFVFGSNLAGHHGGGAARIAHRKFGAEWGVGVGITGQCYAIPTMQGGVETIKPYVDKFIELAREWDQTTFLVTRIGCGIAGFTDEQIAPLFAEAIELYNVRLPESFVKIIRSL